MRSSRLLYLSRNVWSQQTAKLTYACACTCNFHKLLERSPPSNRNTTFHVPKRHFRNSKFDDDFDFNDIFDDEISRHGERNDFEGGFNQYSQREDSLSFADGLTSLDFRQRELPEITKNIYLEHPDVASRTEEETKAYYQEHDISVSGPVPRPIFNFDEISLPDDAMKKLSRMGIDVPTPIQSVGIPVALSGKNLIGIAQTGSGKTLSFILPAVQHIQAQNVVTRASVAVTALVCVPTRELAVQCGEVAAAMAGRHVNVGVVFGGTSRSAQFASLSRRGCDLLIATPGRLMDFIMAGYIQLDSCSFLVLDEADRMLDMGFGPQIKKIVGQIRPDRQLTMWSATWPQEVKTLARNFMGSDDVVHLKIGSSELTANANVEQKFFVCKASDRISGFVNTLKDMKEESENGVLPKTLVFTNTRATADFLERNLRQAGIRANSHHGGNTQSRRDQTLDNFRRGRFRVLVATDVASRGLDVRDIEIVVNYDCPKDCIDYIHRIGRTARGNNKGTSYTFLTEENGGIAKDLIETLESVGHTVDPRLYKLRDWHRGTKKSKGGRSQGGRSQGGQSQWRRRDDYY